VVGEFGILHVVVIRWIYAYQVHRAVGNRHACRGPAEYADGELSLSEVLAQGCNKTGDTFVRINDLRKSPRDTGVGTGEDHLTEGPLDRVVMAAKGINQYTSTVVPPCLPAVVVEPFVDRKLQ